jgi:hypothetical protein
MFGNLPDEFYASIGRVIAISVFVEAKVRDLVPPLSDYSRRASIACAIKTRE